MKALKKYRWPLTGALLGVLVFLAVYGVRVLDPTSVDWILNSLSPDPIQHYLGWELFRRSPVEQPGKLVVAAGEHELAVRFLNLADGGCLKEAEYTFLPIA